MPASSQGSTATWAGQSIGFLTSFKASGGTAFYSDTTGYDCSLIGSGLNTRVVRMYDCTLVDPGSIEVGVYGCPPCVVFDIGKQGTVSVTFEGGSFSLDAFLETFDVSGRVGEFLTGTARFRFSGIGWF